MKQPLILIAEDEADILVVLVEILELEGYRVHSCADGQCALEYIEACHILPDLLITDIMMPRLGGIELIKKIRNSDKPIKAIPVLVYSASGAFKEEVTKLGGKFTPKPFDLTRLYEDIKTAINQGAAS